MVYTLKKKNLHGFWEEATSPDIEVLICICIVPDQPYIYMLLSQRKKNNVYPCKPKFYYIKVGFKGGQII